MSLREGRVVKALSGYYYVETPEGILTCRARGRLRLDGVSPLVGDMVTVLPAADGSGTLQEILPRRSRFVRPAVANIDQLVMVASAAVPVTDPFLIDRVSALAAYHGCTFLLCLNKADLDPGDGLYGIYSAAGFDVLRTSAVDGRGLDVLRERLAGHLSAFTGNSGVGKSSLLNALSPSLALDTGEISRHLGRGRHTTRHVELFTLPSGGRIADTPGFGSFDVDQMEVLRTGDLRRCFPDFAPYLDRCRFADCSHRREPGCEVLEAVRSGRLQPSRHASYVRLWEQADAVRDWELKKA